MDIRELAPWRRGRINSQSDAKTPAPQSLYEQMDHWFDDMGFGFGFPAFSARALTAADFSPRLDVTEADNAYSFTVELPGVAEDDIEISLTDNILSIKGQKKSEIKEGDKDKPVRIERHYGAFARSFTLPNDADEESVDAVFDKGVLTISVKKSDKPDNGRKIEIKSLLESRA